AIKRSVEIARLPKSRFAFGFIDAHFHQVEGSNFGRLSGESRSGEILTATSTSWFIFNKENTFRERAKKIKLFILKQFKFFCILTVTESISFIVVKRVH